MKHLLTALLFSILFAGCTITPDGPKLSSPPPAVQGSNDAQGNPISVPGAGMGVGAGNPSAPGPSSLGGGTAR